MRPLLGPTLTPPMESEEPPKGPIRPRTHPSVRPVRPEAGHHKTHRQTKGGEGHNA